MMREPARCGDGIVQAGVEELRFWHHRQYRWLSEYLSFLLPVAMR